MIALSKYEVLCYNCGDHEDGLSRDEVRAQIKEQDCDCDDPEIEESVPYCPYCSRSGWDACICDNEEEQQERMEWAAMSERRKEQFRQLVREKIKEKQAEDNNQEDDSQ